MSMSLERSRLNDTRVGGVSSGVYTDKSSGSKREIGMTGFLSMETSVMRLDVIDMKVSVDDLAKLVALRVLRSFSDSVR